MGVSILPYLIDSSNGKTRQMNNFSEIVVLITIYCFVSMNIVSVEQNFMVGYVAIGIVSFYILIRFLIIAREIYYDTKMKLKFYFAKRSFRKQRAAR